MDVTTTYSDNNYSNNVKEFKFMFVVLGNCLSGNNSLIEWDFQRFATKQNAFSSIAVWFLYNSCVSYLADQGTCKEQRGHIHYWMFKDLFNLL